MEDALKQLGLSEKEVKFYIYLLSEGPKTAAGLSKELNENRTNSYMILDSMFDQHLVEIDDNLPVRKYKASNPTSLKDLIDTKQQELKKSQMVLNSVLPQLNTIYSLSEHKPGVIYLQGLKGFDTFLQDINNTAEHVDIIASDVSPGNSEAFELLQEALDLRKKKSIKSRIIFHAGAKEWINNKTFKARGMDVRYWGEEPLEGEIVVYGNKLALTVYKPSLITTVITNDVISQTQRTIFEQMWAEANLA